MATIMEQERRFDAALKYEGVLFFERLAATLQGDAEVMGPHLDLYFPGDAVLGKTKLCILQQIVNVYFGPCDRVYLRRAPVVDQRYPEKKLRVVTVVLGGV